MLRLFTGRFRPPLFRQTYYRSVNTLVLPETTHAHTRPATSEPSNKHLSVDAEGITQVDISFIDEPLGLSAKQGHGFIRVDFGDTIGPDQRYKIIRKLGWGMNSSVWMAFDEQDQKYVAIKALKGYATGLVYQGLVWELTALKDISSQAPAPGLTTNHCLRLLSHFKHPGKDDDGDHLCLVTDVLGGDIKSLQVNILDKPRIFPLPLAKRMLLHTLRGIAHMHKCGVVHTDLKHDNIMFDAGSVVTDDLAAIVATDPPRRHPPEESWEGIVQAAVSQPLPLPSLSDAMTRTYLVADFGSAQSLTNLKVNEITAVALRAPETILQGPWNEKVDIWTFGCLVFELTVGHELFEYKAYEKHGLNAAAGHLWQMMCFSGEQFTPEQLNASSLASEYFDEACDLKSHPPNLKHPFIKALSNYNVLEEGDLLATAALMQRCLRLDPRNRPTAEELLQDPWWEGVA